MDIRFSGQNLKITEGMKEHLEERLPKFEKYAPRIVEAHVFLKKEKYVFRAEITLAAKDFHAFGMGEAKDNIFAAMDNAYERVEKQLKKFRSKSKGHHKKNAKASVKVAGYLLYLRICSNSMIGIVRSWSFAVLVQDLPLFLAPLLQALFLARCFFILMICFAICLLRIVLGPTSVDRAVVINALGILIVGFCAILSIPTGRDWYLDIAIAWALQSFIGALAIAKYLEGKGLDE